MTPPPASSRARSVAVLWTCLFGLGLGLGLGIAGVGASASASLSGRVGAGLGLGIVGLGLGIAGLGIVGLFGGAISGRNWNLRRWLSVLAVRTGAGPEMCGLSAGEGWRLMCAAAWLMPRVAGRRWLAEAESFLAEAPPAQRRRAVRSYLATAPQVIAMTWTADLGRRARDLWRVAR